MHVSRLAFALPVALVFGLTGCANTPYVAKPVEPQQVTQKLLAKDPLDKAFKTFCIAQNYPENKLPFASWGVDELTLSALYHHTKLDVSKAQLAAAKAAIESAGMRTSPTLGAHVARSNQANGDIRPFSYGLNVDIPIETANKRALRVEEARHLAEAARLDVAEAGWALHSQLKQDWLDYHEHLARTAYLKSAVEQYDKQVALMQKRIQLGLSSNSDLAPILIQQTNMHAQLTESTSRHDILIARMATDAGLTQEKFTQIPVSPLDVEAAARDINTFFADPQHTNNLQSDALLNRIDIRRSLAKYAAAESKIKQEVAKQTPDISISPGFAFEFGDKIWSLGFSGLLNLLNKNPSLIREAEKLRAVEGAQFEALQATVIGETAQAKAQLGAAQLQLQHANLQKSSQLAALQRLQKQFDAGLIDRLEITQAETLYNNHIENTLAAQFALLRAMARFEDVIQRTIHSQFTTETIKP